MYEIPAHHHNNARAERVRNIPCAHLGCKLIGWEPMRHQPCAGRIADALEPTVGGPEQTECQYRGAQPAKNVDDSAIRKTNRHEPASIDAIANDAVGEFRHTVQQAMSR